MRVQEDDQEVREGNKLIMWLEYFAVIQSIFISNALWQQLNSITDDVIAPQGSLFHVVQKSW